MIDIHSHLFNLKYLPVQGIIRKYTNYIVPNSVARAVANMLIRHTRSDFETPVLGLKSFGSLPQYTLAQKMSNEAPILKIDSVFDLTQKQAIDLIVEGLSADEISDPALRNALVEFHSLIGQPDAAFHFKTVFAKTQNKSLAAFETQDFIDFGTGIKKMLEWICKLIGKVQGAVEKGENFIKWVYLMQHSEYDILARLEKDVPGMRYYVHQMMDVDNYFEGDSYFDFATQQVRNMELLNNEFKDKLIGYIAYDPEKENCLEIVKDAIERRGFRGIKFYPPLGYKPIGNPESKKKYDVRNEALFRYCVSKDIPLFSHCNNEGFEAYTNSGYNSNPLLWQKVLEKPEFNNLRLCLAHAGGTHGWFCPVDANEQVRLDDIDNTIFDDDDKQVNWNTSYAKIVYKLCLKYPNVYCDAAYLDEIDDPQALDNFRKRLIKLFQANAGAEFKFSKKMIFGTDWHMLFQEGKNASFFKGYQALFMDPVLNTYKDDFFENNAAKYLNL